MMPERASRTFICSVLFLDIVEYSRKPVAEQIRLKDRFNALIASAIREIPAADRIILDTGDGVAINFLADPEDALFVAMSLRDAFAPDPDKPAEVPARIGINLGPVRLVRDLNGQPNIIGDGINVAQRVMGFAAAGQILVSRSYYEIVSHISEGYTKLFAYEGTRTDKHVREHEIYSVGYSSSETDLKSPAERARHGAGESRTRATTANATVARLLYHAEKWLGNRSLAYGTTVFASLAFLLALVTSFVGESPRADEPESQAKQSTRVAATSTVTNIGTVTDEEPVLAPQNAGDTGAAKEEPGTIDATGAESSSAPAKKRRSPLSFFKRNKEAETPVETGTTAEETGSSAEADSPDTGDMSQDAAAGDDTGQTGTEAQTAEQPLEDEPEKLAVADHATVALAIAPWGEVYVDGKLIGVSPPVNEVDVLPGRRTIEIRNGQFPPYTQRVELKARQKIKIRYKFN